MLAICAARKPKRMRFGSSLSSTDRKRPRSLTARPFFEFRLAALCSELELRELLGDLDGVPGRALQQLVARHDQGEHVGVTWLLAETADVHIEIAHRFQRH